jgi:hypothetical protein
MRGLSWVFAGFLIPALQLPATPLCIAGGTLASYEALGAGGCTIGPETVESFSFSVVSGSGASISNIFLTPTFGTNVYGVQFASTGFVTGSTGAEYLIGFTWDSIPIRGLGDDLDPPVNVSISTDGCVGSAFPCGGAPVNVTVDPLVPDESTTFSPTGILGISNDIILSANGNFDSIENDAYVVPEPAGFLLAGLGVTTLAVVLRKACRRVRAISQNL